MHRLLRPATAAIGIFLVLASCAPDRVTSKPAELTRLGATANLQPSVRISEIHYDNTGTDAGERVEISAPAGTDLTGWSLVFYNGNTATAAVVYRTTVLSGTVPATCGARGVAVFSLPVDGIQNGPRDGVALVNGTTVVEFLSYEGTFATSAGVAAGMTPVDIGVSQNGTEPVGSSLQRDGTGSWFVTTPLGTNTFGACNDEDEEPAVVSRVEITPTNVTIVEGATQQFTATAYDNADQPISGVSFTWTSSVEATATVTASGLATGVNSGETEIRATAPNGVFRATGLQVNEPPVEPPAGPVNIVEIHYDNGGADVGEAIEIEGPAGLNVAGWSVVLYNQTGGASYSTIILSGVFPDQCSGRGTLQFPAVGIQNGPADGLALVKPGAVVVEFLSYEGTLTASNGPAAGLTSTNIGVDEDGNEAAGLSLQKVGNEWYGPVASSFGSCNVKPTPPPSTITITGRASTDVPLPVGFQDQLFATLRDGSGNAVTTTFTWSSDTPTLAGVDQNGVMTALAAGMAIFRATAADGTTSTISLPTRVAVAGGAQYTGHTEFGVPADGDASDDFILERTEYTSSFNRNRGIPNWVSFNLEATHFGAEDRCDCFTFDPMLPESFARYTTADYTGAGTFHGYGIDRGHLARSFDRTSGSLDNARSFLFSNIIPQAADNNQGPWATMENYVGDLARNQNKEIYVIAGASGSKGTVKNEGKITIPASTWKVVVIMPRDQGLANVDSYDDVEVLAVIMPNDPGIRNVDWNTYRTTVDAVEALSGYNLLALLPDQVEIAVESNTRPPTAALDGPYTSDEGASVGMSGAASSDPDAGDVLTYAWSFGDGSVGSGASATHTYAQNGSYNVTLTVTDSRGLVSVATTTATVANVAPGITSFTAPTSVVSGTLYSASGTFSDPGVQDAPWSYSFGWGEGAPSNGSVSSQAIIVGASHTYFLAGTYTVRLTITDRDGGSDVREAQVQVVRLAVPGAVEHEKINVRPRENGNHRISFYVLSTSTFDALSVVPATARIGSAGVAVKQNHTVLETDARDVNGDGRTDLVLDFYRSDLVAAGVLGSGTTALVLTADLTDGRQIESRAVVSPK